MEKYILSPNSIMAGTSILMLILIGIQAWISLRQTRILAMQSKISKYLSVSIISNLIQESDRMLLDSIDIIEKYRHERGMPEELALAMVTEFKKCHDENINKHKDALAVLEEK